MDTLVVIGDEAACAGFAQIGARAVVASGNAVAAAFEQAIGHASLVVLTQDAADSLPRESLVRATAHGQPPVVVMPGLTAPDADCGVAARVRAALGIGP